MLVAAAAVFMALGFTIEESIESTLNLWDKRITAKRDWGSLLRIILPGVFGFNARFGLLSDKRLNESLAILYGGKTFSNTIRPLRIVATDFHTGDQVVMAEGKLVDAVRASVCIPYVIEQGEKATQAHIPFLHRLLEAE